MSHLSLSYWATLHLLGRYLACMNYGFHVPQARPARDQSVHLQKMLPQLLAICVYRMHWVLHPRALQVSRYSEPLNHRTTYRADLGIFHALRVARMSRDQCEVFVQDVVQQPLWMRYLAGSLIAVPCGSLGVAHVADLTGFSETLLVARL
jgi:hypothetical protein